MFIAQSILFCENLKHVKSSNQIKMLNSDRISKLSIQSGIYKTNIKKVNVSLKLVV